MVSDILPRTPAWQALRPAAPTFQRIDDERAALLENAAGGPARVQRMGDDRGALPGAYRIRGDHDLFCKVVSSDHLESQLAAARIARYLAAHGVATPTTLDGYPRELGDGYILFAFDFVDGRFAGTGTGDLTALGGALGTMHAVLAQAPFAAEVRERSVERDELLERYRRRALEDAPGDEVAGVLSRSDTRHVEAALQAVHGDLHYTNALFPVRGSGPLLLDFEDCRFSHLPRLVDLALVLERFTLVAEPDGARAIVLGRALLDAYRSADPRPLGAARGDIERTLRTLASRALSLLCEMRRQGQRVEAGEIAKFVSLHAQAVDRRDVLAELEQALP